MANITTELEAFKNATYGEDVRDAMISAITAINDQVLDEEGVIQGCKKTIETNLLTASRGSFTDGNDMTFSQLTSSNSSKVVGIAYRITDAFTTTSIFAEGAGVAYPAGTRVYWSADGTGWKTLQGSIVPQLNDFKTEMQTSFQAGVNKIATAIKNADSSVNTTDKSVSGMETAISNLSSKRYTAGYNAGYSDGTSGGSESGYSSGYTAGYNAGKQDGNSSGYSSGKSDGIAVQKANNVSYINNLYTRYDDTLGTYRNTMLGYLNIIHTYQSTLNSLFWTLDESIRISCIENLDGLVSCADAMTNTVYPGASNTFITMIDSIKDYNS